jgi:uncharacterized protein YcnI
MPARSFAAPPPFTALLAFVLASLAASPHAARAHAVVTPGEAPTGAYQRYVLRVPNERGSATVRVHIVFPAGVRVISFDEVPGWTLETTTTDGGASYATATWTGTLPVARFVEFGFIGVNPGEPTTLVWPVVQSYADGFVAEWTGPSDSSTPASATVVGAPEPPAAAPESGASDGGGSTTMLLAGAALIMALASLGLALRPNREA